jgi:hypothetical protein
MGDEIQGQFYEREMTPVIVPDNKEYKIERVLSSKRIKGKKGSGRLCSRAKPGVCRLWAELICSVDQRVA